jgi:hypothetical protein
VLAVGSSRPEPLPADTESRIGAFTELVATAIANAEARQELEQIAAEHAAVSRVATLVAQTVAASSRRHLLNVPRPVRRTVPRGCTSRICTASMAFAVITAARHRLIP